MAILVPGNCLPLDPAAGARYAAKGENIFRFSELRLHEAVLVLNGRERTSSARSRHSTEAGTFFTRFPPV